MKKNDITYEYRVFTNRLIDVDSMEVGKCTSKVIKDIKPKDKVDGRFFHTSDTDEWYFCWKGELQKLNLKGDSDVSAALDEVKKLIGDAKVAVEDAKKTAGEAKSAAAEAKEAAKSASSVVENIDSKIDSKIESKADKTEVEELADSVANKADVSVVNTLSQKISEKADKSELDSKANASDVKDLSDKVNAINLTDYATKTDIKGLASESFVTSQGYVTESELSQKGYATKTFVSEEIEKIEIPTVPTNVSEFTNDANYLTLDVADLRYAPIGGEGVDLSDYATIEYVGKEIAKIEIPTVPTNVSEFTNDANYVTEDVLSQKGFATTKQLNDKQDNITDLETIRTGAAAGATALQAVPAEYVTETELNEKGYLTAQSLDEYATKTFVSEEIGNIENNYYTKDVIDGKLSAINDLIGQAEEITNIILA